MNGCHRRCCHWWSKPKGGRGSVWGTFIGSLLIGVINNGMNLLGISPYFQQVVKGLIIIGAVWLDQLRAKED